ncbi:MAG: hypothetical protein AAFP98_11195 [Pseudomonadota bacterium]
MTSTPLQLRRFLICLGIVWSPSILGAQAIELSQSQLRQLVAQHEILAAEAVVGSVTETFGGDVVDIRGFFNDGRMTYRVLMQRNDGAVIELLMNGQNGLQVSQQSIHGKAIAAAARNISSSPHASQRTATAASATQSLDPDSMYGTQMETSETVDQRRGPSSKHRSRVRDDRG